MNIGPLIANAGKATAKIPWKDVLRTVATLGPLVKKIYDDFSRNKDKNLKEKNATFEGLKKRIDNIEKKETEKAELLEKITEQITINSSISKTLDSRIKLLFLFTILSFIIAIISLALHIF